MPTLRLVAWNCHHGSVTNRVAELADYRPDIAFLQEVVPASAMESNGRALMTRIGPRKGIAFVSPHSAYELTRLRARPRGGRAALAARVTGPVSFTALGIWSRGPNYVNDVMRTLDACRRLLSSGPAVVMGDLNSGSNLMTNAPTRQHARIAAACERLGLVSAYHAFHRVACGDEQHATYRHLFKATQPWHIDFCFVPASWMAHVVNVRVIDGPEWATRSDHHPVVVELQFP